MNYVLSVPNMSCNHCVMRIMKALKKIGLEDFKVKLEDKKVYLTTDDIQKVLKELEKIDYPATIVS
ncbi:MAG: heavy-metal-associated domain-containing protein [Thermotogae bacterium]|nr:heavy-metal-associated domain-containing protein [Thermotogota bacterium]